MTKCGLQQGSLGAPWDQTALLFRAMHSQPLWISDRFHFVASIFIQFAADGCAFVTWTVLTNRKIVGCLRKWEWGLGNCNTSTQESAKSWEMLGCSQDLNAVSQSVGDRAQVRRWLTNGSFKLCTWLRALQAALVLWEDMWRQRCSHTRKTVVYLDHLVQAFQQWYVLQTYSGLLSSGFASVISCRILHGNVF